MTPLRREWQEARAAIDKLLDSGQESNAAIATTQRTGFEPLTAPATVLRTTARERLDAFRQRLVSVKVLDPACGSGNFLYIALRSLLDLEREVIDFAAVHGWHGLTPSVQPDQILGLEINHYAAELARTALWIGYIQWHHANGFRYTQQPLLIPLDTIRQTDAILDLTDPDNPAEPEWPAAEFIVGNPPFLGESTPAEQPEQRICGSLVRFVRWSCARGRRPSMLLVRKSPSHGRTGKGQAGRTIGDARHSRWR